MGLGRPDRARGDMKARDPVAFLIGLFFGLVLGIAGVLSFVPLP
jgi:hypothetical protein